MAKDLISCQFLFSALTFAFLLTLPVSQQQLPRHFCITNSGNFTQNSTYEANLDRLLSSFTLNTPNDNGFYNFSSGEGSDGANAVALCKGDIMNSTTCFTCINNANAVLRNLCPYRREAIIWYDNCLFRYTNRSILGVQEFQPSFNLRNQNSVPNPVAFNQAVGSLLDDLKNIAASGTSLGKFATGSRQVTPFQTIYARVQCTNDLSEYPCRSCLSQAISHIQGCCEGQQGARVCLPSCNFRYEIVRFYNLTAADTDTSSSPPPTRSTSPSTDATTTANGSNTTRTIIVVIASVVGAFTLLIISLCILVRRRRFKHIPIKVETAAADHEIPAADSLQFDFDSVLIATDNFSDANKLGQGGFGAVYKGELPNGLEIAVKRLSSGSGQGDIEFKTEVVLVAKLQHRNLVRLLGFCLQGQERLLIYEFVPNASLDHFIFDQMKRAQLDWETRFKIIGGIVRGLLYLHEDSRLRIIHRDLKASNILLDAEMVPKIADFGMARLFGQDETRGCTSRIVGTYGYMAPEYVFHGQFSVKSDVFSFGVLLLEIISGQKNNSFRHGEVDQYILAFAWKSWREGRALDVVDPTLSDGSRNEIMRCIHVALLCVQENVAARPTMASVALMLNSLSTSLEVPSQPAFSMQGNFDYDDRSSSTSNRSNAELLPLSRNQVSISELFPR